MKENFRSVFLQRLANPNLPWHPETNPYRTIDWMPIDLHVFNSQYNGTQDVTDDANNEVNQWNFASREKSGIRDLTAFPLAGATPAEESALNIWSAWTNLCPRAVNATGTELDRGYDEADPTSASQYSDSCNTNVAHSLGWLNRSFDIYGYGGVDGLEHFNAGGGEYAEAPLPVADPNYAAATFQYPTITQPAARQTLIDEAVATFRTTFPSLVWHNRPYANPHEMLLVPATSNARLGVEYTVSQSSSPYVNPLGERAEHRGAFGHLLNFFHSSIGTVAEQPSQLAGNYFRVFDFVHVPSRFKGTRTFLNQAALSATNPFRKTSGNPLDPANYIDLVTTERPELLANGELAWRSTSISEFREPGKVNINTAPWRVWLELGFDSALKSFNNDRHAAFELSMAGYNYPRLELDGTDSSDGINSLSGRYPNGWHPAEYPNPLRAGTTADLMPRLPGSSTTSVNFAIDGTMLRSTLFQTDGRLAPAAAQVPRQTGLQQPALGGYNLAADQRQNDQVAAFAMQNRKNNAYFRYKDLMKLGNSITSQSNVYAIWVTIGYFEIEPNIGPNGELYQVDRQHPDGYRYGVELGSDLGQVTRNRSFYIVDRSIPVAFEPGVNHNVDDAILVRRHLE